MKNIPVLEILFINNYKCRCGTRYSAPNPRLMYQYQTKKNWTKNGQRSKTITSLKGHTFAGLPREIHQSPALSLEACPACFRTKHQPQFDLELEPETISENAGAITPTPLSDF